MTTPSLYETMGLSSSLFKSYGGELVDDRVMSKATLYSHGISAFGGYDRARLSLSGTLSDLEDWTEYLGYHIEVYNPGALEIFEGFINQVTLSVGPLQITRGPLVQIGNRVSVEYSLIITDVEPPVFARADTAVANDTESQGLFGIFEKVLSADGRTAVTSVDQRDTWISENSFPETAHSFNSSGLSEPALEVEVLGYVHMLEQYVYNNTGVTGTQEVSAKIQAILGSDPNSLFSTDYSLIQTPAAPDQILVPAYENDDNTALSLIKSLVSLGDANGTRYLFGFGNGIRAYYRPMTDEVKYYYRLSSSSQRTEDAYSARVDPWDMVPGYWLFYLDLLVGKSEPPTRRRDIRYEFVESVSFSTPDIVTHNGSKVGKLAQRLAQYGTGGIIT